MKPEKNTFYALLAWGGDAAIVRRLAGITACLAIHGSLLAESKTISRHHLTRSAASIVGHDLPGGVTGSPLSNTPSEKSIAGHRPGQRLSSRSPEHARPIIAAGTYVPSNFEIEPLGMAARARSISIPGTENARHPDHPDNDLRRVFGDILDELIDGSAISEPDELESTVATAEESAEVIHTERPIIATAVNTAADYKSAEALSADSGDATPAFESVEKVIRRQPGPLTITPQMEALKGSIQQVLAVYEQQHLNTAEHSCWSVMHQVLGLGADGGLFVSHPRSRVVTALDWLCANQLCAGRQLLYLDNGLIRGREGPGYQGHPGQFLAILAQINTPESAPLQIEGRNFTVADLLESEKVTCRDGIELTFKLISAAHYLDSDARWKNTQGEDWDIPRLIAAEISQPINGAACGGTHRLMGISYAVLTREQQGKPLTGEWSRAHKYMRDYHAYTLSLQNRDGSFSSDWFKQRTDWGGIDRKIQTTGHMLEWLAFTLPREELSDPRLVKSVTFLTHLMATNRYHEWEVGPKCHAVRALDVYYHRVFGERPNIPPQLTRRTTHASRGGFLSRLKYRFD